MYIHITTQGAKISKKGLRLLVKEKELTHTLFIHKIKLLCLHGNVSVTPQAMKLLMKNNIDTIYMNCDGRYVGRLESPEPKNVFLRKKQFALTDDEQFRLRIGGDIIRGKMNNMATLLLRIKRSKKQKQAGLIAKKIQTLAQKTFQAKNIETLRAYEGAASAAYFQTLNLGLAKDYGFTKRVRRPPTDPVNAVLSLLYTLLINKCYAAIRIAGLDPHPGIIHELAYSRHCLPLDLVEEFRPLLADSLMLALFNLEILKPNSFTITTPQAEEPENEPENLTDEDLLEKAASHCFGQMHSQESSNFFNLPEQAVHNKNLPNPDEEYPISLAPDALKKVLTAFEKKMMTEFYNEFSKCKISYNEAIIMQAKQMKDIIKNNTKEYIPLLLK